MAQRRYFSTESMRQIAEEAMAEGNISLVARRYEVSRNSVMRWIERHRQGVLADGQMSSATVERLMDENRRLKKLVGENELKIAIMEELLKKNTQRFGTKSK
jgi:transposase-like protein